MSERAKENSGLSIESFSSALSMNSEGKIVLKEKPEIISESNIFSKSIDKIIGFLKDKVDINNDPYSYSAINKALENFIGATAKENDAKTVFWHYVNKYGHNNIGTIMDMANLVLEGCNDLKLLLNSMKYEKLKLKSWDEVKKYILENQSLKLKA